MENERGIRKLELFKILFYPLIKSVPFFSNSILVSNFGRKEGKERKQCTYSDSDEYPQEKIIPL